MAGSASRSRFSSVPDDVSTRSVTPLRARISLYFCAANQKRLYSGPAEIVRVLGGAGWMTRMATQITTAPTITIMLRETARSSHEMPR